MTKKEMLQAVIDGTFIVDASVLDVFASFKKKYSKKWVSSETLQRKLGEDLKEVCENLFKDKKLLETFSVLEFVSKRVGTERFCFRRDLNSVHTSVEVVVKLRDFWEISKEAELNGLTDKRLHVFQNLKGDVLRLETFLRRRTKELAKVYSPSIKDRDLLFDDLLQDFLEED